jgi:hypothetical protein
MKNYNKKCKRKGLIALFMAAVLCIGVLTGCGDGIKEETVATVNDKTSQALELYGDIEKMVEENSLQADQSFVDMKSQLTEMSAKVQAGIKEATEEDGQATIQELDRILENLQEVKDSVSASLTEETE